VVICLEQGADLHTMAQLMPLPLTVSCFSKIQIGSTFWHRLTRVVPDKGPLNGCVLLLVLVAHRWWMSFVTLVCLPGCTSPPCRSLCRVAMTSFPTSTSSSSPRSQTTPAGTCDRYLDSGMTSLLAAEARIVDMCVSVILFATVTHTHTHQFNGPLSGTPLGEPVPER